MAVKRACCGWRTKARWMGARSWRRRRRWQSSLAGTAGELESRAISTWRARAGRGGAIEGRLAASGEASRLPLGGGRGGRLIALGGWRAGGRFPLVVRHIEGATPRAGAAAGDTSCFVVHTGSFCHSLFAVSRQDAGV